MAYGNRRFRRRGRRPYKKRKAKSKAITQIVKRVLHSNIENKQAFKSAPQARVGSAFPTSIATGMYPIIPNLVSGLSGDNSKVGQVVKPLSLRLSCTAYLNTAGASVATNTYFDLYVFSIKKINDSTLFDTAGTAECSNFLRPSVSGVDTIYDGRSYNFYQNVNRDVINLIHKKRVKMAPTNLASIGNLNGSAVDNTCQTSFSYTLPLSKHIKKSLKYTNTTDQSPNNCALFATMVATQADATDAPQALAYYGGVSFSSCMVYEDA